MPDAYSLVREAIVERKQIVAVYKGHKREMCPHVIGTKKGREQALFFQFAGSSSQGLPPQGEWRCVPIEGLSDISMRKGAWHTSERHRQDQTCVDEVDVEIDY